MATATAAKTERRTFTLYPSDIQRLKDLSKYFRQDARGGNSKVVRQAIKALHEQLVPASEQ